MASPNHPQTSLFPLSLHDSDTRTPRHRVSAIARPGDTGFLELSFEVENSDQIVWPPKLSTAVSREDGLWRSTCFECFIRNSSEAESYSEWNFSPNGNWAAYDFTAYRAGMKNADVGAPTVRETPGIGRKEYSIHFRPIEIPSFSEVYLSLTAVVLEVGVNDPFYWAFDHVGVKPDFHLKESFKMRMEF